mmetsp:Transcript_20530/g.59449  ORF Transcript_20530/g.59449 Transcript_20530/m.59449 type:complete len:97 (-) Transcript_20530:84-374(-)
MADERVSLYGPGMVKVDLWDGLVEEVYVDEKTGPKVMRADGQFIDFRLGVNMPWKIRASESEYGPEWYELSTTHQTCVLHLVAKVNRKLKERMGWL